MWKPLYLNVGFRVVPQRSRGQWLSKELQKAGPVYVKFGQFISNREDIFGTLSKELGSLRDRVDPEDFNKIKSLIPEEIDSVEEKPIASASISQVHLASYKGRKVVLKIKRPNIDVKFKKDLGTIENFLNLADKTLIDTVFKEFSQNLAHEIDFKREIQNMKKFQEIYENSTLVKIPRVYPSVSNDNVIVMEYVESSRVTYGNKEFAITLMNAFLQQIVFEGRVHGDLHAGNVGIAPQTGRVIMYDFGNVIRIPDGYQQLMRRMFQAIQNQDQDEIFKIMKDMGMKINDEQETRQFIESYLKYLDTVDVNAFTLSKFTSKIPVQFDKTTFQIIRTTGLVEGTCKQIWPEFTYQDSILLCIELIALGF
jgi:predicted unusual protein kinase regulating ubiquinone biosynthesis (AarF/ABC1/UbiB family)